MLDVEIFYTLSNREQPRISSLYNHVINEPLISSALSFFSILNSDFQDCGAKVL